MNIFFDFWLQNPEIHPDSLSYEEQTMFDTIFSFVLDRIIILKEEMDKEEELYKEKEPCVIIHIIKKGIAFNGYSSSLTEKLKSCFNENDQEVLGLRFDEAFRYLN